ncbi:Short chain alcohol dehydrogenase [Lasiodiplodia theobromae]|uniref:Short chain alcohol dehydrogenase n=1 Tax=Lasiodiplodia theobromae TaxID=45133 RepID=UPI0015C3FE05|nr:Short chain alcohol dehydrogenase [Lasiodiplodia theobromae]KAF4542648.1 Short chain alcohol dehydrogenase [Lasiodiplodia theobromae]
MPESSSSRGVVISGGGRGIGRALARHFLNKGDRVFLLDVDADELHHTVHVHLAKHHPTNLSSSICDLRNADEIRKTITDAAKFLGGHIDVLINNASIATPQWKDGKTMLDASTLDEWRAYVDTNLTAPFAVSQAALPYMRCDAAAAANADAARHDARHIAGPGPCIVHVGSFRAHQSDPNQEGYAATKAGQLGLMHSMAVSCEPWGIRVNLVAPGRIKVAHECKEGDEKGMSWAETLEEKDVQQHPANRAGMPEDIAQAVEYLVNAGFVTGQEITVDGGALKKKNK